VQRVVTIAGDSVVGTPVGEGKPWHVIEGKRVGGGLSVGKRKGLGGGQEGKDRAARRRAVGTGGKKWLWRRKSVANRGEVLYHKWFLRQALIPHGRYPRTCFFSQEVKPKAAFRNPKSKS
jgi:hypothetical protein